jgi:hypothetical protein
MTLDSSVDRYDRVFHIFFYVLYSLGKITFLWLRTLQDKLHHCDGVWLRCNTVKGSDHLTVLRLALHQHSSTLYPVQLRILG